MPNWCSNTITSTEEVINALRSKEGGIDFNNIVPMPPHQPDLTKPNPFFADGPLGSEEQKKYGKEKNLQYKDSQEIGIINQVTNAINEI